MISHTIKFYNMPNKTYQIKIALKESKPSIWRRILVPSNLLFSDLHKIIQTTMGWENSHLHQFKKGRITYSPKMPDGVFWGGMDTFDYTKLRISEVLKKEKDKMIYEYDFGDSWLHDITLEKIEDNEMTKKEVTCLAGKNSCPPEDCGGIWGYYEMLEIIKDPDHEEYEDYIDWLGEEFDPEYFDKIGINTMLKSRNFGCFEFF